MTEAEREAGAECATKGMAEGVTEAEREARAEREATRGMAHGVTETERQADAERTAKDMDEGMTEADDTRARLQKRHERWLRQSARMRWRLKQGAPHFGCSYSIMISNMISVLCLFFNFAPLALDLASLALNLAPELPNSKFSPLRSKLSRTRKPHE